MREAVTDTSSMLPGAVCETATCARDTCAAVAAAMEKQRAVLMAGGRRDMELILIFRLG
jgi:hypothetical protein